ncbi:MAG: hypothetical protein GY850_00320 [bacterium]|nr:hypothetical protein [bacterium]
MNGEKWCFIEAPWIKYFIKIADIGILDGYQTVTVSIQIQKGTNIFEERHWKL